MIRICYGNVQWNTDFIATKVGNPISFYLVRCSVSKVGAGSAAWGANDAFREKGREK